MSFARIFSDHNHSCHPRGAVNTYGSALYGLGEFPGWADPLQELNCTFVTAAAANSSLPSPLAAGAGSS